MAVKHRKIGTGIETLCNLPAIKIKAGSIAELNCREAAYLNLLLLPTRLRRAGERYVKCSK